VGVVGLCVAGIGCEEPEGTGAHEGNAALERDADLEGEDCDEHGELNPCSDDEDMFNVCDHIDGRTQWGECHAIECMPGDHQGCGELGSQDCVLSDGIPVWGECIEGTPLVLSFDGAEPVMSDASAAPAFDIGTGGACIQTDWPAAETPWLALDRDGSGTIDGGHELFGSGTVLASGRRAQHGFVALAELDSNGDGRITKGDERFEELVLWADHDRDKRSTTMEHESLGSRGIVAIALQWRDERVCDERGNCGVERAKLTFVGAGGRLSVGEVVDVHLACQ
jgi:hypothetical protein